MSDERLFLGIDPGSASGAFSIIYNDLIVAEDCNGTPSEVWNKLEEFFTQQNINACNSFAAIERVSAMPKQGVTSVFKFGENFGAWQGILLASSIPYELVSPRSWMKDILGSAGSTNDGSLEFCRRQFPHLSWKRKKDHGRADSACIALWAKKRFSGV